MAAIPNIVPISDLRQDASGLVKRVIDSREPVFITQRGGLPLSCSACRPMPKHNRLWKFFRCSPVARRSLKHASGLTWKTF